MNEKQKQKGKRKKIELGSSIKYCVGTEPSALVYIGILVTSTTIGGIVLVEPPPFENSWIQYCSWLTYPT